MLGQRGGPSQDAGRQTLITLDHRFFIELLPRTFFLLESCSIFILLNGYPFVIVHRFAAYVWRSMLTMMSSGSSPALTSSTRIVSISGLRSMHCVLSAKVRLVSQQSLRLMETDHRHKVRKRKHFTSYAPKHQY